MFTFTIEQFTTSFVSDVLFEDNTRSGYMLAAS